MFGCIPGGRKNLFSGGMLISQEGDKYMKKLKRGIAFILTVCTILTLLPVVPFTYAANVVQRYELDTDGIDPGATYLIVNAGTTGGAHALMFYYQSNSKRDLRDQTLNIQQEDGVIIIEPGFTNEEDCQFQFSSSSAGTVTHGNYYLDLANSRYASGNSNNALTFTHVGNGQYRIHYSSWFRTYYLRYNNNDWASSTSSSSVYLFKLVERTIGYNVTFDGNGYTGGTLPENETMLSGGTEYTVPWPKDLRKDVGEETWLFHCWNTAPDGSGTEYKPEDTIVVNEDITLYANWYQQTKHSVSMITYLDGVATDVNKFAGYDRSFYAVLEGGDGSYITLNRTAEGTYSAKVVDNGTYIIYAQTADGRYEPVHGHSVVIYGQDGTTECLHYSITYDANGGTWADGEEPAADKCHFGEEVIAYDKIPTKANNRFLCWEDEQGNRYAPGQLITSSADKKIALTAVWEEQITVTVDVVVDHTVSNNGYDVDQKKHEVTFTLLRMENGVNLPVAERTLTVEYDKDAKTTTYQVVFAGMPQGIYHVASTKSNYETTINYGESAADEDQKLTINLKYAPDNYDLTFDVVVKADNNAEMALRPKAVNVKISAWADDENNALGWQIITQQEGDNAPTTITIDENGHGTGSFPVWAYWPDGVHAYYYRIVVTSFVMPDGTIVPASGNHEVYTANGSGLYQAKVTIEGENCKAPSYPEGSNTDLLGAHFDGEDQHGIPLVTVEINPLTVTFDAGNGKVNGQQSVTLSNQYRYPSLHDYTAVPNEADKVFVCWVDAQGNPVEDLGGQLLAGNVTYYARYNENITISGNIVADVSYQQDNETVYINETDLVKTAIVVLQKKVGDVYNDIKSVTVDFTYKKVDGNYTPGQASYEFKDLPNDGTEYRVHLLVLNYNDLYNNDRKTADFSKEEAVAKVDQTSAAAQVDIHLDFDPDVYQQAIYVDASQIHEDFRPTDVLAQILYRDLGDVHNYNVITQHTAPPYGVTVGLSEDTATGTGIYDVWNWHTKGTPYEYQLQIAKVFGNVKGVYDVDGTTYTDNPYFTIVYGSSNNYLKQELEGGVMLEATLVPKKYSVHLDLNLGDDPNTPVVGLEAFMVDDGTSSEKYAFEHTWSYKEQFVAYPYREGYVFKGWVSENEDDVYLEDGIVHVGDTLANDITLTAQWEKMKNTDYTILYLELNTDKVLQGATMVSGATLGDRVVAADKAVAIKGYVYAGAVVDGAYISKIYNPAMTVTNDPKQNMMVIYYLPDGSDGYTEQVESNLEINKQAVLENDGTYTITMDTYTKDNPITTLIQQNTPIDIVMVLDQSASIVQGGYLDELKSAVDSFIDLVAKHGRNNEVDHRIAIVGYAGNETSQSFADTIKYPIAGGDDEEWVNTGVFDSNGDFHSIKVTGFNYTPYEGEVDRNGTYYTYSNGEYLLLTYHDTYYHLITAEEARIETISGTTVYGYVDGTFVTLTRNTSGLWLYGDRQLYSLDKFFTFHEAVWTHRSGTDRRQIHGYTVDGEYKPADNHQGLYVRQETQDANPQLDVYKDALVPVSVGANGSGGINPGLLDAASRLGSNGQTYVQYGLQMANKVFAANPLTGEDADRIRIVVMFTDGMPGSGTFDEEEANAAIAQAYITKNTHDAYLYTVGLYSSDGVKATDDEGYFMNGVSSNYPEAMELDDVRTSAVYSQAPDSSSISYGGPYFVKVNDSYYELTSKVTYQNRKYWYTWGYDGPSGREEIYETTDSTQKNPAISGGKVGDYVIYKKAGGGYQQTPYSGYYSTTDSEGLLQQYFANIVQEITTKVTTKIVLESDTILRDIMNQGMVLTNNTVITVYTQEGNYNATTGGINWTVDADGNPVLVEKVRLNLGPNNTSAEGTSSGLDANGNPKPGVKIITYNYGAANATDPNGKDYKPHTVDITGYDFHEWYISEKHTTGYKMIVTITGVEATDDVQWGKSTATNNEQSGLWLPADKDGNRQLLLPFNQPSTIFVERAYVLDYGKEFTLSGWYFDDEDGKEANPIHLDLDISNGMNGFITPNKANAVGGAYGNTKYGNVSLLENGQVTYTPTSMNWGGYDQFYVFGNTWRKTVKAQDANENGNLWNKVTVIPANNIYYEDSFITSPPEGEGNGISGFTFSGAWTVEGEGGDNQEVPEHLESAPYGDVHGWTDSLGNDVKFTDGSAHVAYAEGYDSVLGASVEFTFTGTGVEVYTRTNAESGFVVAALSRITKDETGKENTTAYKNLFIDNLAVSGDYYHIPTVAFKELPYGTYHLKIYATAATSDGENLRSKYYIDGVRIHNPLGNTTNYQTDVIKDAYGLENNAVFTEIRDILIDKNNSFNADQNQIGGAVFIDQIKPGQELDNDQAGTGVSTYEIGTFKDYGPKNEVYLSAGQAIVLKVAEGNTYYVGMKSLTGQEVTVNVSGIDQSEPTTIKLSHTTDMYYQVTPVNGYIVIQNGNTEKGAILSLTNLRTTNLTGPAVNGGVVPVATQEAVQMMSDFSGYLLEKQNKEENQEPEEEVPSVQEQAQTTQQQTQELFTNVRQWLETN